MPSGDGLTKKMAGFYAALDYESLPPTVVDRAKYFCLDYLGVALRGSRTASSLSMQRAVKVLSADGGSVIMGTPLSASPEYAALANGTAAHSLELDDVSNDASLHAGVATFPAAFACADLAPVDGRSFITAVAAGYDLMIRLSRSMDPIKQYARGFHPTGTCGAFGAAATSSRLLKLDAQRTTWAMGVAGSQAAGSQEFLAEGAWTKRLHAGWAAHSGMIAALLAREGFVAPTTILEGRYGFLHGYSDGADPAKVDEDLGELFYINKVSVKPHACCRYNQGPIDCVLQIASEHSLGAESVEKVTVGILEAGYNTVAVPVEQKRSPRSVVDAQFSMPFSAAVALVYGRASLDEFTEETLDRPEIVDMMSRVSCVRDPVLEANFPSRWPAWVEIETRDGRRLRHDLEYPKGDPENALSWDEMEDKFRGLTASVISVDKQEEIIATVHSLEALDDIRVLSHMTSV